MSLCCSPFQFRLVEPAVHNGGQLPIGQVAIARYAPRSTENCPPYTVVASCLWVVTWAPLCTRIKKDRKPPIFSVSTVVFDFRTIVKLGTYRVLSSRSYRSRHRFM